MLFPKTRRTDMDLELTKNRFDTKQFDKQTLQRIEKQEMQFKPKIIAASSLIPLVIIAYLVFKK